MPGASKDHSQGHPPEWKRFGWQVLVALVATLYAIFVPLDLIFRFPADHPMTLFRWVAPAVFGADLILMLVARERSVGHRAAQRISEGSRIRWILAADIVAAIPLGALLANPIWGLLGLAKLVKVGVFLHLWRQRALRFSAGLLLAYTAYWLGLCGHWISCGWLALREPNVRADPLTLYVDAIYWTVTTVTSVGYGDITPVAMDQKIFAILTMIVGLSFLGYIVGVIASTLSTRDPAAVRFRNNVEQLGQATRYWALPTHLQDRIYDYHWYMWKKRLGYDESDFMDSLPKALKAEVSLHLKREVLDRVELFQGADDEFLMDAALHLTSSVLIPGETVMEAGDEGTDMYFIVRGELDVETGDGIHLATLSDGEFFGEIALFGDTVRTATVRAVTYCDVYVLSELSFRYLARKYPEVRSQVETKARARAARTRNSTRQS